MNTLLLFAEAAIVFTLVLAAKAFFGKSGLIAWVGIASVLANIVTAKSAVIFGLDATLGTVLFASTFLATDILSECYSKKDAKAAVWLGLFSVSTFIIATQIALLYIPSQFDYASASMETLFSLNLQISLASMLMYFLSNMGDVLIFNKMKEKTGGRYLWLRNNLSTILCNCLENFGFIFLAFWGVYPVEELVVIAASTSIIEIVVAACDTPFLYVAKHVKELRFRRKAYEEAVES